MTPAAYMTSIVVPCIKDFRDHPRSRRHAYIACIVLFHLKDYLKRNGEAGVEQVIRKTHAIAFDAVRGVCNGTKHVSTDASHAVQFAAGQDWDRPPAFFGTAIFGVSRFGDKTGGREFKTNQGNIDIYHAVKAVLKSFHSNYPRYFEHCEIEDC